MTGFAGWTLLLIGAMIAYRIPLVLSMRKRADAWTRGREVDQAAVMTRLEGAYANCLEMLPIFASVVLVAAVADAEAITAGLAGWFLAARIGQSVAHIISVHHLVIFFARFPFFLVQVLILAYWIIALLQLG
ncbi:MAPEG family protein [Endozoicomonas sp. G2_2]|uniref:MAPEG family protein n=1 Tax=Endozoicomonas sp. G2_2 TaxID=2821092 RepID=UPI001ADA3652|nr:MAPEG family protein [Endozoicomonas sp. G2_2]MBO9469281.1 MAPEG family protein [Endozoicomonas sp. G2_2]